MSDVSANTGRPAPTRAGKRAPHTSAKRPGTVLGVEVLDDRVMPSASAISGFAFQDLTGNGLSAGAPGLAGVKIELYQDTNHDGKLDTGDQLLATQKTAADGFYSFGNLNAGTYFVAEVAPSGFVQTAPTLGTTVAVAVGTGQQIGGVNFADFQKPNAGVITNVTFTVNDPTLGTYTVTNLRGATHQGDTVTANFTVTGTAPVLVSLVSYDAPGATFDANTASQQVIVDHQSALLNPGPNSLTVHLPQNFYQVDLVVGAPITQLGPAGSNLFYSAEGRLISADNEGTQAFAPATLSGVVYTDTSGTGVYNSATDAGLAGVTVTVTGTNDLGQAVTLSTVSGPTGSYSLTGLRPGTYTITQTTAAQTGFVDETSKEAFTLGGTATPGQIANITVTDGAVGANYNLPEVQAVAAVAVSGIVYADSASTGIYNTSDAGLGGVTVTLTGTNYLGQPVTLTTTSATTGAYLFSGVLPGTYAITYGGISTATGTAYNPEAAADAPAGTVATAGAISNIVVSTNNVALNLPEVVHQGSAAA